VIRGEEDFIGFFDEFLSGHPPPPKNFEPCSRYGSKLFWGRGCSDPPGYAPAVTFSGFLVVRMTG